MIDMIHHIISLNPGIVNHSKASALNLTFITFVRNVRMGQLARGTIVGSKTIVNGRKGAIVKWESIPDENNRSNLEIKAITFIGIDDEHLSQLVTVNSRHSLFLSKLAEHIIDNHGL